MWHDIFDVLANSTSSLTTREIASRLTVKIGVEITPKQVYSAIAYQWRKENLAIFGEFDNVLKQYKYKVDVEYYQHAINGKFGV